MHSCSKIGQEYSGLQGKVLPAGQGRSFLSAQPCLICTWNAVSRSELPRTKEMELLEQVHCEAGKMTETLGHPSCTESWDSSAQINVGWRGRLSSMCVNTQWRKSRQGSSIPLSAAWGKDRSQWTQPETWSFIRKWEDPSLLGDTQTPAGDTHHQSFLAGLTWADEVWRGPFHEMNLWFRIKCLC